MARFSAGLLAIQRSLCEGGLECFSSDLRQTHARIMTTSLLNCSSTDYRVGVSSTVPRPTLAPMLLAFLPRRCVCYWGLARPPPAPLPAAASATARIGE